MTLAGPGLCFRCSGPSITPKVASRSVNSQSDARTADILASEPAGNYTSVSDVVKSVRLRYYLRIRNLET
jgi:hypothetical protein